MKDAMLTLARLRIGWNHLGLAIELLRIDIPQRRPFLLFGFQWDSERFTLIVLGIGYSSELPNRLLVSLKKEEV